MSLLRRPKHLDWSNNSVYGVYGEAWDGSPNKIEPATGFKDEGYKPGDRPSSAEWNWWREQVSRYLQFIHGLQFDNFKDADFSLVNYGAPNDWVANPASIFPVNACYDDSLEGFTAIDTDGVTIHSIDPNDPLALSAVAGKGLKWKNETSNPEVLGFQGNDIASDQNGSRIAADGIYNNVARSSSPNVWAAQATATAVVKYSVDHDWSGLWAVSGASGCIDTAAAPAGPWTARTSGVSETILSIRHNHESGSTARWVALGATKTLWSSDGITWSNANHSLTSVPLSTRLVYSALSARWFCLLTNGDMAYSDDQGQTWTQVSDPFGIGAGTYTNHQLQLESDNMDGLIFHYSHDSYGAGSPYEKWVSLDKGTTWKRCYEGLMWKAVPCWGADRFASVGYTEAKYSIRLLGKD